MRPKMPGLGAVEAGAELDAIRATIRRGCRRARGQSMVDSLIDMVLAPLVMDCMNGCHRTAAEAAKSAGEDLRQVLSRPPLTTRPFGE